VDEILDLDSERNVLHSGETAKAGPRFSGSGPGRMVSGRAAGRGVISRQVFFGRGRWTRTDSGASYGGGVLRAHAPVAEEGHQKTRRTRSPSEERKKQAIQR